MTLASFRGSRVSVSPLATRKVRRFVALGSAATAITLGFVLSLAVGGAHAQGGDVSADAKAAVDNGADGIIVSNHGGRQISSVPGVAAVTPSIVDAVGDRAEVFLDGGIRRGEDIVKARALGATAASGGRLWFWGLAAGGQDGVRRVLSILEADVDRTLALIGRRRYDDVGPDEVHRPQT